MEKVVLFEKRIHGGESVWKWKDNIKKIVKIYFVKSLISGSKVTELDDTKTYVAIPDKGYKDCKKIKVVYGKEFQYIFNWHKAVLFKRFHDQYGGQDYVLGYFEWLPTHKEQEWDFTSDGRAISK